MKIILITGLVLCAMVGSQLSAGAASCCATEEKMSDPLQDLKYTQSEQYGHDRLVFSVAGRKGFVILPEARVGDKPIPWVWYAPTFVDGGAPGQTQAWIFTRLLDKGFAICGVDVGESYGSLEGRKSFTAFYKFVVSKFNLSSKACLWAQSRGGLMHFNWAADHPEYISCIGATYPICLLGTYAGYDVLARTYGISEDDLRKRVLEFNPLDRLAPLAKRRIHILSMHGDKDVVVPLDTNSAELAKRYKNLGGSIELIVPKGRGHEEVADFFESQSMVDFFVRYCK